MTHSHTFYPGGYYGGCRAPAVRLSFLNVIPMLIIVLFLMALVVSCSTMTSPVIPDSTVNRKALEDPAPFQNDCIIDELGWFDDGSDMGAASRRMQHFYNKTGVQPYVVLKEYMPGMDTDEQKEYYAQTWYDVNIDNEDTFLYMYFAEEDPDQIGYMVYVNGKRVTSIMDSEAVNIFWAVVDRYWETDMPTGDMFASIFIETADRIMEHTTTTKDVAKYVMISVCLLIIGGTLVVVMVLRRKHEKERNAETERILKVSLDDMSKKPGEE